ncbi:permease [Actinocrispum wychmicini]|uniref:Permease n=1 Tax=Actinocrispum wychmicini TaxID=1213861 RepID=A0A4R2JPW9_9PSEU|nr:permease [Actinocrispum wychmicini]TCO61047.1 hypothetical protein EV192_103630 [Actinocrispum wychmicini]
MIAGHFGFAAAVKAKETRIPLWTLMLATAWLDVVFVPLLALKVETIEPVPGSANGYGESIIHADYTHSVVGALVLAAAFGAVAGWRLGRRAGLVLGGVVFSHWVLDLIVHRMDLPILPGNAGDLPRLGFGLWRLPAVSVTVEVLLMVVGFGLYWRAAARIDPKRARLLGGVAAASGLITVVLDLLAV